MAIRQEGKMTHHKILWTEWFGAIMELRPACARMRTFLWLTVNAVAMTTRVDLLGVTSFVRSCWLEKCYYKSLLNTFNGN